MTIVTLPEVQTHLGIDGHDDELQLLIGSADNKIEDLAGPVVPRSVTQTVLLRDGYALLDHVPLTVTGVVDGNGAAVTGWAVDDIGGIGGMSRVPYGRMSNGTAGPVVTVTYSVGRDPIAPKFKRAALRFIAWSWQRDHGGSETYMPGGDDATVPGPGVRGIDAELRMILGPDLRGPRVQ